MFGTLWKRLLISCRITQIVIYFDYEQFQTDSKTNSFKFLEDSLDNFDKYCQRKKIEEVEGVRKLIGAVEFYNKNLPREKKASFYHGVTGAMDLFSIFRGTENFFVDLYDNPQKVKQIFEFITERSLEWLDFQEKQWGNYIGCRGSSWRQRYIRMFCLQRTAW